MYSINSIIKENTLEHLIKNNNYKFKKYYYDIF